MTLLAVMTRAAAAALVLVVAMCAAACTGPSTSTSPSPGPRPATSAATPASAAPPVAPQGLPPTTLAGFYAQHLTWTPCNSGFQCTRLYVPFDYAHPGGPAFSLPVVRLPAADPEVRIGDLVINPGGPGGSGIQYALQARSGEFSRGVLDRFDIVGFDPRGVGGSIPAVRCLTGPQLDKYFAVNEAPSDATQLATVVATNKGYAQACASKASALLRYVGTAAAARDMDILRAALGQPRLIFLGKSYGTVLGASYVQQFPSRVGAVVLDGAVAPTLSGIDLDIAQAEGFEVAFGQFVTWCFAQSQCPLQVPRGQKGPGVMVGAATADVSGLISKANVHPLASQLSNGQQADGAMLLLGVAAALYSKSSWPFLRDGLTQAFRYGDGTTMVELADSLEERSPNGTYSNLSDAGTAVDCVDRTWPRQLAAWQAAAATAARVAPLFGPTLVWGSLPCAYWPVPASPVLAGSSSGSPSRPGASVPVLVVGDLHDPATPYPWAVALARWLPHGVLLGWNGEGHTSYMQGSSCVDNAVNGYLINLSPPPNGTVCQ